MPLTHWGRTTHICVGKLTTIGLENSLSPGRRQAIIWTIDGILLIGPLGTNFSEIFIGIQTFSFKKMHLKISSAKWRPFVSASMSKEMLFMALYTTFGWRHYPIDPKISRHFITPKLLHIMVEIGIDTIRPRQNGGHFPDDIFQMHFLEWKRTNFD